MTFNHSSTVNTKTNTVNTIADQNLIPKNQSVTQGFINDNLHLTQYRETNEDDEDDSLNTNSSHTEEIMDDDPKAKVPNIPAPSENLMSTNQATSISHTTSDTNKNMFTINTATNNPIDKNFSYPYKFMGTSTDGDTLKTTQKNPSSGDTSGTTLQETTKTTDDDPASNNNKKLPGFTFFTRDGTNDPNKILFYKKYKAPSIFKKFQPHPRNINTTSIIPLMEVRRNLFDEGNNITTESKDTTPDPINTNNIKDSVHTNNVTDSVPTSKIRNPYAKSTNPENQNNHKDSNNSIDNINTSNTTNNNNNSSVNNEGHSFVFYPNNIYDTETVNFNFPTSYFPPEDLAVDSSHLNKYYEDSSTIFNNITPETTVKNINLPTNNRSTTIISGFNNFPTTVQTLNDSSRRINLPPELESLKTVIMSQHKAFEPHIKNLGKICLEFTTLIENKKETSKNLATSKRIPRSLRIKCDLKTPPAYRSNTRYIELKSELKQTIEKFSNEGREIYKKWSAIYVELLTFDRCNNVLQRAIHILDGICSYWTQKLTPITWPNHIQKHLLVLLIKIYFTSDFLSELDPIIQYFELPVQVIILIASKIITNNPREDYNMNIIDAMSMSSLDDATNKQATLITETLLSFDAILRATTIQLWAVNLQHIRENEASMQLKAKMEATQTASATEATAIAIENAVNNINDTNNINQLLQLRIANLEKQLINQKQSTNELANQLKAQQRKQNQGYYHPKNNQNPNTIIDLTSSRSNTMVDLTSPQSYSSDNYTTAPLSNYNDTINSNYGYNQRTPNNFNNYNKRQRTVQWSGSQPLITQFNPNSTPSQIFGQPTQPQTFGSSITLNPFQLGQALPQPPPQITPFYHTDQNNGQPPRGARSRGGRRGMQRRPRGF
jgi:hypothetical protein